MHLTRLRLDPRNALARRDLADPYDMHRTLVRAFVRDEAQIPPRFLWRLEAGDAWTQPVVLVQSAHAADWSFLSQLPRYLQLGEPPQTKTFDPGQLLEAGSRYRFRLAANPTVSRAGKRHGLVGEDAQLDWLGRQCERGGFGVEVALVSGSQTLHSRKGPMRVSLLRVCFEGTLQVRDVSALSNTLQAGVGPGKAFGCGLLSIARIA
jgi:CRISPR system Cascade subunit CasE